MIRINGKPAQARFTAVWNAATSLRTSRALCADSVTTEGQAAGGPRFGTSLKLVRMAGDADDIGNCECAVTIETRRFTGTIAAVAVFTAGVARYGQFAAAA